MTITVAIRNMTSSELAWYSSPNQTPTSGLQVVEADLDEVVVRYANGPYPVPTSGGKKEAKCAHHQTTRLRKTAKSETEGELYNSSMHFFPESNGS